MLVPPAPPRYQEPYLPHDLQSAVILAVGATLLLLTVPLVLELLLTTLAAALPGEPRAGRATLSAIERLVVVVPAHNEERSIAACVRSLAHAAGTADGILVVVHNGTDRTALFAQEAGAIVTLLDGPGGKGNALAHGFALAFGRYAADAVLIVDADSTVSPNLIAAVKAALAHAYVVQTRYEAHSLADTPKGRLHALSFLCKNVVRASGRHRLGLSCGLFGNGFALRREALDRVPYNAHSIVEDLEFHLALLAAGIPTRFVPDALVLAEVPATAEGQRTQTARWEGGRLRMLRAHTPRLLRQVLSGRLRLAEPLLDLLGLPIALQVVLLTVLLALPGFRAYAGFAFLILALHLALGVRMSPHPRATAAALLQAPWYVLKKLTHTPAIARMAGKRAVWVKTSRAAAEK